MSNKLAPRGQNFPRGQGVGNPWFTSAPHSGLIQAYIGSNGTDGTASRLSLVEETEVPGENQRIKYSTRLMIIVIMSNWTLIDAIE